MANDKDKKEVFLSYSTKNVELAHFLCNQMEGAGIKCWIAPRDIPSATPWARAIVDGIEKAELVVLLVSEASLASEQVEKEIDIADGVKIAIIPVRIENVLLTGALKYHLSNKQWVDALDDDKFKRFTPTVEAVLSKLNKSIEPSDTSGDSPLGMGKRLAQTINEKHRERLSAVNSMFSCADDGEDKLYLFFPIRAGATGIDLIFYFDAGNRSFRIYSDAASDADPMRMPFMGLCEREFGEVFPDMSRKERGRRWRYFTLMPDTKLTTSLVALSAVECFKVFEENIIAFSGKVLPLIFDFMEYAQSVSSACVRIEEELKSLFPEKDGWHVGAPEGKRLSGLIGRGNIAIYKDSWQPNNDNYKGRGFVSIVLESGDAFLTNVYFGIKAYEAWHRFGDFRAQCGTECDRIFGAAGEPDPKWIWWQCLETPWRNSGINEMTFHWKDKLDEFVQHCTDQLSKFKEMEKLLDKSNSECPEMQILPFDSVENSDVTKENWDESIYVNSWLAKIAEEISAYLHQHHENCGISVEYIYRAWDKRIYLKSKVESFEVVIAFICYHNVIKTEIVNLDPPDYETPIVEEYLKAKGVSFSLIEVKESYDGLTFDKWLRRFKDYIAETLPVLVPQIIALRDHLLNVVALTKEVEAELGKHLLAAEGWVINNRALCLERNEPISIFKKSWSGLESDDSSLIQIELNPQEACFDDLKLIVRNRMKSLPEMERDLGAIRGAFDFAFGIGDEDASEYLWARTLSAPFNITHGSAFSGKLLEANDKSKLMAHMAIMATALLKTDEIITMACNNHNNISFPDAFRNFIENIGVEIKKRVFPEDEWSLSCLAYAGKQYNRISFAKASWKTHASSDSVLSIVLEAGGNYFDGLYYAVRKGEIDLSEQEIGELKLALECTRKYGTNRIGSGGDWPCYFYFAEPYSSAASDNKILNGASLNDFIAQCISLFTDMKNGLAPTIDGIVAERLRSPNLP